MVGYDYRDLGSFVSGCGLMSWSGWIQSPPYLVSPARVAKATRDSIHANVYDDLIHEAHLEEAWDIASGGGGISSGDSELVSNQETIEFPDFNGSEAPIEVSTDATWSADANRTIRVGGVGVDRSFHSAGQMQTQVRFDFARKLTPAAWKSYPQELIDLVAYGAEIIPLGLQDEPGVVASSEGIAHVQYDTSQSSFVVPGTGRLGVRPGNPFFYVWVATTGAETFSERPIYARVAAVDSTLPFEDWPTVPAGVTSMPWLARQYGTELTVVYKPGDSNIATPPTGLIGTGEHANPDIEWDVASLLTGTDLTLLCTSLDQDSLDFPQPYMSAVGSVAAHHELFVTASIYVQQPRWRYWITNVPKLRQRQRGDIRARRFRISRQESLLRSGAGNTFW